MDQNLLRTRIRAKRQSMLPGDRDRASGLVRDRFQSSWRTLRLRSGLKVGSYRPTSEEIDVDLCARWLEDEGLKLHFPRIVDHAAGLLAFEPASLSVPGDWAPNRFGILEPARDASKTSSGLAPQLDVILVPGVVFGEDGQRIGLGKGFYDRALALYPNALKVGLAYDFQVVPTLEENPWDQRVDWIVSERREIQTCRVRERVGQLTV